MSNYLLTCSTSAVKQSNNTVRVVARKLSFSCDNLYSLDFFTANAGNIAGTKNTTRCHSLNGKWNFAYYENIREAFDIVEQTYTDEISVPDVWQFAGYEKPFYINVAYPFPATPPYVPDCAPGAVYNMKFSYNLVRL